MALAFNYFIISSATFSMDVSLMFCYNFFVTFVCCVPEEIDRIATVDSKFWRVWKLKLEEQKRMADHSRLLEQVLPGIDVSRSLSGDVSYIEDAVFSLIESIQLEKKHILKKLLLIAQTYSLNHSKVNKNALSVHLNELSIKI